MKPEHKPCPPPEVLEYYASFSEESRREHGIFQLEFVRSKEILTRVLPSPPARVIDVGGAAGAYSFWLAAQGYEVHLVDASPRLVEVARKQNTVSDSPLASMSAADARNLPQDDGCAEVILLMGPLYHLILEEDRRTALQEALRVLTVEGTIVAAAISRYVSALDGLVRKLLLDSRFVEIRDRDLADGQHRNETGNPEYFTTAYFHCPEDLCSEMEAAGFTHVKVFGVEGPGWMLQDFDSRWIDPLMRRDLVDVARALESEPSVIGVSAHLLAISRKPE